MTQQAKTIISTRTIQLRLIIAVLVIAIVAGGVVYAVAVSSVGGSTSTGRVANGASVSIVSATISNGTETLDCSYTPNVWSCNVPTTQQGHNMTTSLVLKNVGSGLAHVYSTSQAVKGATDGTLLDANGVSDPLSIGPNSTGTLEIIFMVSASAQVGDVIQVNSIVF